MYVRHELDEESDEWQYLLASARIRKCTPTALVKRVFATVMKDQMILSILDDDSKPAEHRKGDHGFPNRYSGAA